MLACFRGETFSNRHGHGVVLPHLPSIPHAVSIHTLSTKALMMSWEWPEMFAKRHRNCLKHPMLHVEDAGIHLAHTTRPTNGFAFAKNSCWVISASGWFVICQSKSYWHCVYPSICKRLHSSSLIFRGLGDAAWDVDNDSNSDAAVFLAS